MIKWRNISFPESFLIPMLLGVALNFLFPWSLLGNQNLGVVLGIPLLFLGLLIVLGAAREVGSDNIESPTKLVVTGPYAWSRNPMYLAWAFLSIAAMCLVNSVWLLLLFPVAIILTHFIVLREERKLEEQFGEEYKEYREQVRRYI